MAGEVEGCGRMSGGYASRRGVGGGAPETMKDRHKWMHSQRRWPIFRAARHSGMIGVFE